MNIHASSRGETRNRPPTSSARPSVAHASSRSSVPSGETARTDIGERMDRLARRARALLAAEIVASGVLAEGGAR